MRRLKLPMVRITEKERKSRNEYRQEAIWPWSEWYPKRS